MVRPMVHSTKHYVQTTFSNVTTGAKNDETYVTAVEGTVANLANEVVEGATIKAVFFEMWLLATTATQFFTAVVAKIPGSGASPSFTQMTALNSYPNKKNIFYTTQGLAPNDGVGQPINIYRGWIKIPKSKQRFGLGDKLIFTIASRGDGQIDYCGFVTYKEYT